MENVVWLMLPASAATVAAGVTLIAAAVVILSGEVIVEVAVAHVGGIVGGLLTSTLSESGEGEAVEVGLCVVHVLSIGDLVGSGGIGGHPRDCHPRRMEEKKGTVVGPWAVFMVTNQSQFF